MRGLRRAPEGAGIRALTLRALCRTRGVQLSLNRRSVGSSGEAFIALKSHCVLPSRGERPAWAAAPDYAELQRCEGAGDEREN